MSTNKDNLTPGRSLIERLRPKRLATQFILIFGTLLLISMVAYSYRALNEEITQITETMRGQSRVLAKNLAATGGSLILDKDYTAIEQMLLRTSEFPGISSLLICNGSGRIFGHVKMDDNNKPAVVYDITEVAVPQEQKVILKTFDNEMVVWQPIILGELIGWVKITYQFDEVKMAEQRIWKNNALVGFVILLLAIVMITLVLRRPLASIGRYTKFALKLVDGKGKKVTVSTQSEELMILGEALNHASTRLHIQETEIRQALQDLERLAAFPEQNPNIVLSLNRDGELQYLNPFGRTLLNEFQLPEDKFTRLLPDNFRHLITDCLDKQSTIRAIECAFYEHILLWTFAPVKSLDIVHGYAQDITEKLVAERRANETQVEMSAVTAANKAKSIFLANMSHEMRTPLTAIIGFSESLLEQGQTMQERIECINTIVRASKHLLQLINEILDLSKIEAEKLVIENIQVDLFELVKEVTSISDLQAQRKGLRFDVQYNYPLPRFITTDPVRLKEILLNLVNNAIKFTDEGYVKLEVDFLQDTKQSMFAIIDSGLGMTQKQMDKIFQPFTQADSSTTRKYGGTGLGLYLSRLLVEKLGGGLQVSSEYGKGSKFSFSISVGDIAVDSLIKSAPVVNTAGLTQAPITQPEYSGNVLLVEDNPDNQRLIMMYLKKMGATVTLAENGRVGVEKALDMKYQLILMDMQMPEMDGLEATMLLRESNYTGPIYALTANEMPSEIQACLDAGCDGLLGKPIDRAKFQQVVLSYLQKTTLLPTEPQPPVYSELLAAAPELTDLVGAFVNKLPVLVKDLNSIVNEKDWENLKAKIHDLKGVSGSYGFPQVSKLAEQIEFEIAKQSYQNIPHFLAILQNLQHAIHKGFVETHPVPIAKQLP